MTAPSDESLSISRTKARNPLPICSSKKLRGGLLNRHTSTRPCCSVTARLPLIVRPVTCEPIDDELDRLAAAHPEHVDGADLEPGAAERPVKLVVRCREPSSGSPGGRARGAAPAASRSRGSARRTARVGRRRGRLRALARRAEGAKLRGDLPDRETDFVAHRGEVEEEALRGESAIAVDEHAAEREREGPAGRREAAEGAPHRRTDRSPAGDDSVTFGDAVGGDAVVGERREEHVELRGDDFLAGAPDAEGHGIEHEVLVTERESPLDVLSALRRGIAGHQLWSPRRNSRILHHSGVGSGAFQSHGAISFPVRRGLHTIGMSLYIPWVCQSITRARNRRRRTRSDPKRRERGSWRRRVGSSAGAATRKPQSRSWWAGAASPRAPSTTTSRTRRRSSSPSSRRRRCGSPSGAPPRRRATTPGSARSQAATGSLRPAPTARSS